MYRIFGIADVNAVNIGRNGADYFKLVCVQFFKDRRPGAIAIGVVIRLQRDLHLIDRRAHQSRSNSLIPVFDRVCASTVLTITAQYRLGPGMPSTFTFGGKVPGTTTE